MLRRYIFIKLNPDHASGLALVKVLKTAKEVLHAAHGVQSIHVGRAADETTSEAWDVCLTLEFMSNIDLERGIRDPVTRAFVDNFLGPRTEKVWMATFEGDLRGPRRL